MSQEELRKSLDQLRRTLEVIDPDVAMENPPAEAIRALDRAVNGVRSDIWSVLTTQHADDYDTYLGKMRVRRATETCEDVLADLYTETLSSSLPGLEVFQATLRELSRMCDAASAESADVR